MQFSGSVINPLLSRNLQYLNTSNRKAKFATVCLLTLTLMISVTSGAALANEKSSARSYAGPMHCLTVKVQDPRCPACLKTLQRYLLKMRGVKIVRLPTLSVPHGSSKVHPPQQIDIWYLPKVVSNERLTERIRKHDLEIVHISNRKQ